MCHYFVDKTCSFPIYVLFQSPSHVVKTRMYRADGEEWGDGMVVPSVANNYLLLSSVDRKNCIRPKFQTSFNKSNIFCKPWVCKYLFLNVKMNDIFMWEKTFMSVNGTILYVTRPYLCSSSISRQ